MSSSTTPVRPAASVSRVERELLDTVLERAADGDPSVVVLAGDAGVGKSCLLRLVAESADATVLFGTCVAMGDGGSSLSPIVEALRFAPDSSAVAADVAPVLELLVTGRSGPRDRPLRDRTGIFESVLDLLERLADRRPTLLVIEDLHAADPSTLDLITFLVSNLRCQRLAVMVSYRSDDLVAEHPCRPVLAELVRHPRVGHVDLPSFDRGQVAEQLATLTGRAPDQDTVDEVVRRTRGNAFFIEELVDAGDATIGSLSLSLRELLLVKVEALSPATCRLLRIMSLGRPETSDDVLAAVAGIGVDDVRIAQREALDRRVLAVGPGGPVFRHPLVREALEQDLMAGERRELHACYADALAANPTGREAAAEFSQLAHHRFESGDVTSAIRLWTKAATAAEQLFAYDEAHRHLERVLQQWDRVEDPELLALCSQGQMLARAAEAAFLGGHSERACELVRDALGRNDELSDPTTSGILFERLARYINDTADRERALEFCQRAVDLVPASPVTPDRARVLSGWAGQLMIAGRLGEARTAAVEALSAASACDARDDEGASLNTLGVITCATEDDEVGLTMIRSALEIARRQGNGYQQMRAHWNLFACTFEAGRWKECLERFDEARAALPRLGQGHLLTDLYRYAADALMRLGRWDESDALTDEGLANLPGRRQELVPIEMLIARGRFDDAREVIAQRMACNVFVDDESHIWPFVNLADVETWSGHTTEARRAVDEALGLAVGFDFTLSVGYAIAIGLTCEADAAEIARKNAASANESLAVDRARSLLGRIHELLERPGPAGGWKREVTALARQCEAELGRALGASDPDAWTDAVSAWRALEMPYEVARCQFGQANALLSTRADRKHAGELLEVAGQLAARLDAAPLRAQVDALARRARIELCPAGIDGTSLPTATASHGLTNRELEVLSLLATGASNRGIADTLFISVKTAGVHVSNILRKLEVANRAEATSVAFRDGLLS